MLHSYAQEQRIQVVNQRNLFFALTIIMFVLNLVLSIALFSHEEKVILVPPEINKTFWIKGKEFSKEYFEEMSIFISSLILDQTPLSSDFRREVILKYVSPDYYNALFQRLTSESHYIKEQNISTKFNPQSISVDEKNLKTTLKGELVTYVADNKTASQSVLYTLEFEYSGYKLLLKSFSRFENSLEGTNA